jgi:Tfp pilus assembly protein PilX
MKIQHRLPARGKQRGVATLFVALALLAILTVVTIFAANIGFFEQKTSANEYRHKLSFQAAEAGLNQSIEYLKINSAKLVSTASGGWLFPGSARWQSCNTALPTGMAYDPCLAEANTALRAKLYRYVGSTSGVLPLSDVLPAGASQTFTTTGGTQAMGAGGFTTSYQTYATLCRLDVTTAVPQCALSPANEGTFYVTVVSRGAMAGESAAAVVKESFGTFRLIGRTPDAPLIAAGTSVALGSAELVPNPNAAGFGIPVSIWAKGNASVAAADFMTCQLGEWLTSVRTGGTAPSQQDLLNGVCPSCTCGGLRRGFGFLSGKYVDPGGGTSRVEALDILDVEGSPADVNVDRALDSKYFPDDLFLYVFGIPKTSADSYLTANATPITDCSTLTAASSGLYWYKGTADCTISDTGSLAAPVVLVSDRKVVLNANSTFFGIIFVRDKYVTSGELLKASGTPQVYGSVILEGSATINGSPGIIYNKAVLQNVFNSPKFIRYGAIPGSWSDTVN